jgi:hypothetical protein
MRQKITLDLREPEFDLVEPRRVRRREMDLHVRMLDEEGANGLRLMRLRDSDRVCSMDGESVAM